MIKFLLDAESEITEEKARCFLEKDKDSYCYIRSSLPGRMETDFENLDDVIENCTPNDKIIIIIENDSFFMKQAGQPL